MLLSIPKEKSYRLLFAAQIVSLAGTGVTTIALALLAHKLAGGDAGIVLGTALAIKMSVYVFLTPVISAISTTLPHKKLLVFLDVFRGVIILGFFGVSEVWHIYLLIFLLNAASAAFTPVFQASIPALLSDERDYTKALSLSRIAYDLENILSPLMAGVLLTLLEFNTLFLLDSLTFFFSAGLILPAILPDKKSSSLPDDIWLKVRFGISSYLKTPRLRFALALVWVVSFAGAMVIVNTVILVREQFQSDESQVALAFVFTGIGSIIGALILPLLKTTEKKIMFFGAVILTAGLAAGALIETILHLYVVWSCLGFGWALVQTPVGQLLKKSSAESDRAAYFAAHFALSHFGWLIAYPLVGYFGKYVGVDILFLVLSISSALVVVFVSIGWQGKYDVYHIEHSHPELEHAHAHEHRDDHHLHDSLPAHPKIVNEDEAHNHKHRHTHKPVRHAHYFVIDLHHRSWPTNF